MPRRALAGDSTCVGSLCGDGYVGISPLPAMSSEAAVDSEAAVPLSWPSQAPMTDQRQEARKIIADVARAIDRRLSVEVREVPGQERLQLTLTHGTHHGQIELGMPAILAAGDNPMARNELRLRLKRATDTMLFRPMPDHRLAVKPVEPPGGHSSFRNQPRGRGRR
jgi:hypothetical protein